MTRYRWFLLCGFFVVWVWAAWRPKYPFDWFLENILVLLTVPAVFLIGRYFRLSDISYTLLALFLCFHVVGSHYTYAEVPFGFTLQRWFNLPRNPYDRLVHFLFGFLLAYPIREAFLRLARVRGFWGYYVPFDVVLAFSGGFEIVEWLIASVVRPEAGTAYLGTQGDEWDAQKDMLCAASGAALAMVIVGGILWYYRGRAFWEELRDSIRLAPGTHPIDEDLIVETPNGRRIF